MNTLYGQYMNLAVDNTFGKPVYTTGSIVNEILWKSISTIQKEICESVASNGQESAGAPEG